MIRNAATRAVDHIKTGQVWINVGLENAEDDALESKFVLTVEDDGCGMHENLEATAFVPFTLKDPANLGLGLHVVVNLVSNVLSGTIQFEAGSSCGVIFTVELPAGSQNKTEI